MQEKYQLQPVTTSSGPVQIKTSPELVAISLTTIGNRSIPVLVQLPEIAKLKDRSRSGCTKNDAKDQTGPDF